MSTAGDYVGEEVWHRIVQIVINTEELQEYATRKVYEHLRSPACHGNIIKVAAYLLGEFGHLIASEEDAQAVSPIEQFTLINSKVSTSSAPIKALILTTYVKWLNLFPEIRQHILVILQKFTHTLDAELQQRACEYIAIASMKEEDILQVVVDEMPPFPEQRESALLSRLMKKHSDTGDKRTWVSGGKDVNVDKDGDRYKGFGRRKAVPTQENGSSGLPDGDEEHAAKSAAAVQVDRDLMDTGRGRSDSDLMDATGISTASNDIMGSLAGLDLTAFSSAPIVSTPSAGFGISEAAASIPPQQAEAPLLTSAMREENGGRPASPASITTPTPNGTSLPSAVDSPQLTHGTDKWLARLAYNSEGVLYEDAQLQVGMKSEYHGPRGRLALYFGNKISAPFTSFTVTVQSQEPNRIAVSLPKMPPSTLTEKTQIQQVIQVDAKDNFTQPPVVSISYLAGSHQTVILRLPVLINKFVESVLLSQVDFFERWKQIGGSPREAQSIFPVRTTPSGTVDFARNKKVVKGLKMGVLEGIDPNPNNIVAAGVLHTEAGKIGCLLRLEPNTEAKVSNKGLGIRDSSLT